MIYLVIEYGGEYEDHYEKVLCAYEDKKDANAYARRKNAEIKARYKQSEKCLDCNYYEKGARKPKCYFPDADGRCMGYTYMSATLDAEGVEVQEVVFFRKGELG